MMSRAVPTADTLEMQLALNKLPPAEREVQFHPVRKWRFDFAWPKWRLAIECEGGVWVRGRHTRGAGYVGDLEKYNTAALLGWTVLRFTPEQIRHGLAIDAVQRFFAERAAA